MNFCKILIIVMHRLADSGEVIARYEKLEKERSLLAPPVVSKLGTHNTIIVFIRLVILPTIILLFSLDLRS